ncbi:MAG: chemotaxis response regulator protein-glutamate methylesterase [Leptospiraceae bacterium]|nr:chemotaxis response regulator protein-glutamate methylesterase [Leptospiraceae bacterium]MDW7976062.1 chemotaxis response regulator protein-glutamate methylesterase [Leptospiraceae bacterium]
MREKIKVLIVDDSAIVRDTLTRHLNSHDDIEVVGTAPDPYIARDKIVKLKPDVLLLDIEMPKMDGLSFLEKLMVYHPLPVIIVSSITTKDTSAIFRAFELGAFDVVNKSSMYSVQEVLNEIVYKVRQAFENREVFLKKFKSAIPTNKKETKITKKQHLAEISTTDMVIGIGASTGGTTAIEFLLSNLPKNLPPILIVQHMPPGFTNQFAHRLNEISQLQVKEAEENDILELGKVLIAPGGFHLKVLRMGNIAKVHLDDSEKVNFQKPSVDVLFESLAETFGKNTLAILLTGMGKDGAAGLWKIKQKGGYTIVQDEETSIVWGMPKAAIDLNAHTEILPLSKIPEKIIQYLKTLSSL